MIITTRRAGWGGAVTALGTLAILLATLHRGGHSTASDWSWSITSGDAALAELLQNLIFFAPLGIGLTLAGVRLVPTVLIGTLLSFSVEFAQQWIPGRDPSVGDIICNAISTAIGAGLTRLAPQWLTVPPERSGRHAIGAALFALLIWFGTAAALWPTFPPGPHRVEPRPDFKNWGRWGGEILDTRLNEGMLSVRATFPPDHPPRRPSPLAAVLDARETRATILSANGRDLSMRYYMPAARLTLEQPDLVWEDALANLAPADTFSASTGHDGGKLCLAVNTDWRCNLGYTIGDGWKLIFYPEGWPGWVLAFINACWVAGCVVFTGFWAARGGEEHRKAARLAIAIVLLGMILVPATTHLKATTLVEWIGGLLGIELGLVLGTRTLKGRLGNDTRP